MSAVKNLFNYYGRFLNDMFYKKPTIEKIAEIVDVYLSDDKQTVMLEIDADKLLDYVKDITFNKLKEDGIAYEKLQVFVPELGKTYQLIKKSENRAIKYKQNGEQNE